MSDTRGRLGRYAAFQFRDALLERGVPIVLVGLLIGWTTLLEVRVRYGLEWQARADAQMLSTMAVHSALTQFGFLAILIAASGIVANDRRHGYFRLLFAKPIGAVRYYLQAFVIAGVGLMIAALTLHAAWAMAALPVAPWGTLRSLGFYYVVVGSTAFLMSSIVRWDWVGTAAVWGGSSILRAIFGQDHGVIAWAVRNLTAPTHIIDALRDQLYRGEAPATEPFLWALAWSLACVAGGVAVIRYRPMAQ